MAKNADFSFDTKEWDRYFKLLEQMANGELKKAIAEWFEACGIDFLAVVQDEIISRKVVDTRRLLSSFEKSGKNNYWKVKDGGLTLEVGTKVKYAEHVNDGHWTNPKGQYSRWVPGTWHGERFIYNSRAKTGMLLKQQRVNGAHYWESAIRIYERIFKKNVESKMEQWRDQYFR